MDAMPSQDLTPPNVGRTLFATRSDSLRKSNDLVTSTLGVCAGLSLSLSDDPTPRDAWSPHDAKT